MIIRSRQSGFTAVELLITLFIASLFLIAGYQLFGQVMRDGTDANNRAVVSSRAYDKLREYSQSDAVSCADAPITDTGTETIGGIKNVQYTVTINCVAYNEVNIKNLKVLYNYTDFEGDKMVSHGMYVR